MFWYTTSNKIFFCLTLGNVFVTSSLVSDNICDDAGSIELLRELPAVGTFSFLQSYQRTVCDFCLRDAHHPDEHAGEVLIFQWWIKAISTPIIVKNSPGVDSRIKRTEMLVVSLKVLMTKRQYF